MPNRFVSYSEMYEDVLLNRVFKDIAVGFYVDVGAMDPTDYSVTKTFYDRGWTGINIEPVDAWFEKLQSSRPRDINLKVAIGKPRDDLRFFEIGGTGLSTASERIASRHAASGHDVKRVSVPSVPLSAILEEHSVEQIHFLKIDVEGSERDVLESIDFGRVRPWIIVIEGSEPVIGGATHQLWEDVVLEADYLFGYGDDLNRYYVAAERKELLQCFSLPPDAYVRQRDVLALNEAQRTAEQLRAALDAQAADRAELRQRLLRLETAIANGLAKHEVANSMFTAVRDQLAQVAAELTGCVNGREDVSRTPADPEDVADSANGR